GDEVGNLLGTGRPVAGGLSGVCMKLATDVCQFRGEAIVKADSEITDADIVASNLVLWGDPASNKILAKIIGKLPLTWNSKEFRLGERELDPGRHVAVMIYPNPLNTKKYVVLNSGFTFREYDYLNNARQVPKLPDYALIDVSVPADARKPGGIVAAGFFDEQWKLPPHTLK
ncbi:MAG: hypothetical protein ACJ8F7_15425, partial [Gemmataceae bacterium]